MGENSKIVTRMMAIKHASQNMKMVCNFSFILSFSCLINIFHFLLVWKILPSTFSEKRVARGCSTKRPMLYVECEAHKSKNVLEEFCYCSYDLCNTDHGYRTHLNTGLLFLIVMLVVKQANY